jgi:hypothetical protein
MRILGLGVLTVMLAIAGWPAVARACSCGPLGITRTTPPGIAHPANADVVLWDSTACTPPDLTTVAARIDGAAATLADTGRFFSATSEVSALRVRVTPAPMPGQVVEIVQCTSTNPCTGDAADAMVVTSFAAVEPDVEAPGMPTIAGVTATDWATFCGETVEGWEVALVALPPASATQPLVYRFELVAGPGGPPISPQTQEQITEDEEPFTIRFQALPVAEGLPDDADKVCVRVTATDLAGNAGPTVELCGAFMDELCDDCPDSSASGGLEKEEGCGCRSDAGGGGVLGVVLLGWWRRSRRTGRSGQE